MLKVWVNPPKYVKSFVSDIDLAYKVNMEDDTLHSDIAKRILDTLYPAECYDDKEQRRAKDRGYLVNCGAMPEGAKMLLLMLSVRDEEFHCVYDYAICGKNCDKFLEEIADIKDIEIALGRVYVPFVSGKPKSGVKFMESGTVVYDAESFIKEYRRLGGVG